MHLRNQINSLFCITAMVNLFFDSTLPKFFIYQICPGLSPLLQHFRSIPVCRWYRIKFLLSFSIQYRIPICIKEVFPLLLFSPGSILSHGANRTHHMNMGIWNTFSLVRVMNCHVHNHALCHKILHNKLPCYCNIFFYREFILKSNIKTICQLCFRMLFNFFHCIPQKLSIMERLRNIVRSQNLSADYTALGCVICNLSVIMIFQSCTGSVSSCFNRGLSSAS